MERKLREYSDSLASLSSERKQLQEEHQEHVKQRARMELNVKDLEQNVQDDQSTKVLYQQHTYTHTHNSFLCA